MDTIKFVVFAMHWARIFDDCHYFSSDFASCFAAIATFVLNQGIINYRKKGHSRLLNSIRISLLSRAPLPEQLFPTRVSANFSSSKARVPQEFWEWTKKCKFECFYKFFDKYKLKLFIILTLLIPPKDIFNLLLQRWILSF